MRIIFMGTPELSRTVLEAETVISGTLSVLRGSPEGEAAAPQALRIRARPHESAATPESFTIFFMEQTSCFLMFFLFVGIPVLYDG